MKYIIIFFLLMNIFTSPLFSADHNYYGGKLGANNGVDIGDVTINNTGANPVPISGTLTATVTPGTLVDESTEQDMGAGNLSWTTAVADDWDLSFFLIKADGVMSEEVNVYLDSASGPNFDVLIQTIEFSGEADYIYHWEDGAFRLRDGDEIKFLCTHNADSVARTLYILVRVVK